MDSVIKDYLWNQKRHYMELVVAKRKGHDIFSEKPTNVHIKKNGKYIVEKQCLIKKGTNHLARFHNPLTGKIETVDIREHNKRVFSGMFNKKHKK